MEQGVDPGPLRNFKMVSSGPQCTSGELHRLLGGLWEKLFFLERWRRLTRRWKKEIGNENKKNQNREKHQRSQLNRTVALSWRCKNGR
jgi:hypothetical protein